MAVGLSSDWLIKEEQGKISGKSSQVGRWGPGERGLIRCDITKCLDLLYNHTTHGDVAFIHFEMFTISQLVLTGVNSTAAVEWGCGWRGGCGWRDGCQECTPTDRRDQKTIIA